MGINNQTLFQIWRLDVVPGPLCAGWPNARSEGACADASLYRRFRDAGLKDPVTFPHFTPFTSSDPEFVSFIQTGILTDLTPEETQAWHVARAKVEEDGSFVLARPHHCAVGTKG
tara:strand:- start:230 stop:574 length:345 start_codon:yes stop_codon:yes gene_type:complete